MISRTEHGASAPTSEIFRDAEPPRICMLSARKITRRAFQCANYEAQDVLQATDQVDLISPEPGRGFRFKERWQRRLLYRDLSERLIFANPGLQRVRLTREYDLFVVRCQTYWDLLYVNAIDGWKDRCKTTVCWIDELYAAAIPLYRHWLHALRRFDHVFVGFSSTVAPLSAAINRPCRWLPAAVDTLRFSPFPNRPERVIDVYSIGRRWANIHRILLRAAARGGLFYVYDTFPSIAEQEVYDHQQHRDFFAHMIKRSRYFMVAPGKVDTPEETHGQMEIGHRYYEGAAAGAVMIGQPPQCSVFAETFAWPDVVVPIQPDGSDVVQVLAQLTVEPSRVAEMSRRNAVEALLRHDWVYRWKEILRVSGLEPSPEMIARERRLRGLVELGLTDDKYLSIEKAAK
jgi:hypothetical protein